jgi:hypothetical protein
MSLKNLEALFHRLETILDIGVSDMTQERVDTSLSGTK